MISTTVPAAVDRLCAIFTDALPDARVDDGPTAAPFERDRDGTDLGVVVGWRPSGPGIENDVDREGAAGVDRELYRVWCTVIASNGETVTRPLRELVYATIAPMAAALRRHHPLVRGVLSARIEVGDYEARITQDGAEVQLLFAVEVDAFAR